MKQYYSIISAAANRSISQIPYPTVHHSVQKMCTFLLLVVRYGTGALWDFRIRPVLTSQKIRSIILWWWEGAWKRSRPFLCSPVASIILFCHTWRFPHISVIMGLRRACYIFAFISLPPCCFLRLVSQTICRLWPTICMMGSSISMYFWTNRSWDWP